MKGTDAVSGKAEEKTLRSLRKKLEFAQFKIYFLMFFKMSFSLPAADESSRYIAMICENKSKSYLDMIDLTAEKLGLYSGL